MAGVNQKIRKVDYNSVQSDIDTILGTGSGNFGYGQPILSQQVDESNSVTINEYAALRFDIINAYKHLFNSLPPDVDAQTLGSTVRFDSVPPDAAPISYWQTVVNSISTNRLALAVSGQRATVNHGTTNFSSAWGASAPVGSTPQLSCQVDVEWTTSEQARHFFNTGSTIQFTSSRTGGSTTAQNTSWTTLLSTAGARIFGGNTPGTGTSPNDGQNWFRARNTADTWSNSTASSPYALNEFKITVQTTDIPTVSSNSTGSSRKLRFIVYWNDNHFPSGGNSASGTPVQSGGYGPDTVDGTISLTVQTIKASGVLEPTASGNFEVLTPTVTIGTIVN
tara:strand:- start:259 stop:1266 length:1008 start_codon:yes stop_codon:yes gene_type:complete